MHSNGTTLIYADDSGFETNAVTLSEAIVTAPESVWNFHNEKKVSTPNISKEFGRRDPGEATVEIPYVKAVHAALEVIHLAKTKKYWKSTYPDSGIHKLGRCGIGKLQTPEYNEDNLLVTKFTLVITDAEDDFVTS